MRTLMYVVALLALTCGANAAEKAKKDLEDYLGKMQCVGSEEPAQCWIWCFNERCEDGTYSFFQPGDPVKQSGYCGPVALANFLCNDYKFCREPLYFAHLAQQILGGGTTLEQLWETGSDALVTIYKLWTKTGKDKFELDRHPYSMIFFENVIEFVKTYDKDLSVEERLKNFLEYYLASDASDKSIIVGLGGPPATSPEQAHATTIVDFDRNTVVHNTWMRQYTTPWHEFHALWKSAGYMAIVSD
ncbi:MAG: hypothetical protein F4053_00530 [Proteobacteria bacterium]|nr:hypothetical protein [Pseudomonadota bacterium]MYJ94121.1 hypothetical protein [Pseudomonadota bacterium]